MGTSTSARQLTVKLGKMEATLRGDDRTALVAAGKAMALVVEHQFAKDGLRKGAKLAGRRWGGIRADRPKGGELLVRAAPPAWLFNNATSPHYITSKWIGGTRSSRTSALGGSSTRTSRKGRPTVYSTVQMGPERRGVLTGGTRRAALNIPGIGHRRWARHTGTDGSGSWGKGVERGRKPAKDKYSEARRQQIVDVFR